jgi:DNA polymerase-3 subunit alpha
MDGSVTIAPNDFTHLHVHSEFSLLDGLGRITELVDSAAQQGFDSLALTDHGALYGAVAFYQACRARNIKPIIGVETYVARRAMTDKEGKADAQPFHLVLLARTGPATGTCAASSPTPTSTATTTSRASIASTSPATARAWSAVGLPRRRGPAALEVEDWELARKLRRRVPRHLRPRRLLPRAPGPRLPEQRRLNEQLLRLAPEIGLPLVVDERSPLRARDQSEAHDVLLCVGTATTSTRRTGCASSRAEFYLKSRGDGRALPDQPDATPQHEADRRDDRPGAAARTARIPQFPVPDGETVESWLARSASAASSAATAA